ncbi:ATP-binding protein [Streptomyces sp. TR06-5]|uniref:ATP-binding protein n=1 Tax=unclassified Streptomyces TaxID=2593676 RepID=UPI0039A2240D
MQSWQVRLEIGADPTEVGRARRWARARLHACGVAEADEQLAETVVLLVSELVTNAVVHTGRPAVLRLCLNGSASQGAAGAGAALRLEVLDAVRAAPRPRRAEGEDTGGRGLELVSGLADRWGWHPADGGKRIWCEFDRVPAGAAPAAASRGLPPTGAREAATPRQRTPGTLRPLC